MDMRRPAFPGPSLLLAAVLTLLFWTGAPLHAQPNPPPRTPSKIALDEGAGDFAVPDAKLLAAIEHAKELLKDGRQSEAWDALAPVFRSDKDFLYRPDPKVPVYRGLKAEARRLAKLMPMEPRAAAELRRAADVREKAKTGIATAQAAKKPGNWLVFRGDAARNAAASGGPPLLELRWRLEVTNDDGLANALRAERAEYQRQGIAVHAGLHPLVVGDVVLMRSVDRMVAADLSSGKRLWQTESDVEQDDDAPNRWNGIGKRHGMSVATQYGQRIWDDATYGTLSSDGQRAFVVEALPLGVGAQGNFFMAGNIYLAGLDHGNRLSAYHIRTGKLAWQLGADARRQPDTFFLGSPLPLAGRLYVLAEVKDEIRLLVLDGATGDLCWSQSLSRVRAAIDQDPIRRLAGVSPSYSDGVLVCPTGGGSVVALDAASHSLLWAYVYPRPVGQFPGSSALGMSPIQTQFWNANGPVPRWIDGVAVISDGRVLLTPAEADMLYCLNLADGTPCWKPQPRGDRLYIACVHNGTVMLAGRNSFEAIRLKDGENAWGGGQVRLGEGLYITGHGFAAGNEYYLPLSSGDVATFEIDHGWMLGAAEAHDSAVPGNLVCAQGVVVSQGLDGVELYYQRGAAAKEAARRLAADPNDVEGLTLRGEIALDAGNWSAAVADYRRAYALDEKLDSHVRTRELLRDALMSGLRDRFAVARPLARELEKLLQGPEQRATYLHYMIVGLEGVGAWQEAVENCLELADFTPGAQPLERAGDRHFVRRDRWLQGRLLALREKGGAAAAGVIDRALAARLEDAKQVVGADGLKRFLAFFDHQPQSAAARAELIERLAHSNRLLEAELQLARAADLTDRRGRAALLADTAALDLRAGRVDDAAACYRELVRRYADVPCHAGLTPAAWLAALAGGDALRKGIARPAPVWPKGKVEVQSKAKSDEHDTAGNTFGARFDLALDGPSGPFFSDCTVGFDNRQQKIVLRDGNGRQTQSPIQLADNNRRYTPYPGEPGLVRTCGHLLILSVGAKVWAIDPWHSWEDGGLLLWSRELPRSHAETGGSGFIEISGDLMTPPWTAPNAALFGPVNARVVCYRRSRDLVAADPVTGETLWLLQDIPTESEIFGDEQYIFVLPRGASEASVYRALDGELVGTCKMPAMEPEPDAIFGNDYDRRPIASLARRGAVFIGRNVLTWRRGPQGGGRVLSLFDIWRQQPVWPERTFASGSQVDVAEQSVVGVFEPSGDFVLLSVDDGHAIADVQLKLRPHFPVMSLLVVRLGDQYFVVTQDRRQSIGRIDEAMQGPQGMLALPLDRSRIYAINMQGKLAWPDPIDIDHHEFLLSQPARLPLLTFCSSHYSRQGNQTATRTALTLIDRRDGRVVYEHNREPSEQSFTFDVEGDPTAKTMRIEANDERLRLKFTDKPDASSRRRASGGKTSQAGGGGAVFDAEIHALGLP